MTIDRKAGTAFFSAALVVFWFSAGHADSLCNGIKQIDASASSDFADMTAKPQRPPLREGGRLTYLVLPVLPGTSPYSSIFVGPGNRLRAGTGYLAELLVDQRKLLSTPDTPSLLRATFDEWIGGVARCFPTARHQSGHARISSPVARLVNWQTFTLPSGNQVLLKLSEADPEEPMVASEATFMLSKGKLPDLVLTE